MNRGRSGHDLLGMNGSLVAIGGDRRGEGRDWWVNMVAFESLSKACFQLTLLLRIISHFSHNEFTHQFWTNLFRDIWFVSHQQIEF